MPVHPQVQAFLDFQAEAEVPPISEQTPAMAREGYMALAEMLGEGPAVGWIAAARAPGPAGGIPLRVYRPSGDRECGVLVYYHGGGWVIGDLNTHDHACRALCASAGCVVVSVDYRLAPEHPFPAAVDDAWAALGWVAANHTKLGGDGRRLAVGGDSAGGNLATVVSHLARDAGGPEIALQLLVYPAVDMHFRHGSIDENAVGYVLTKEHMHWFRNHYLPNEKERDDWRASPILARSHAGLPPALIITAEFDPLRDEGEAYGAKLRAAGVPVTVSRYDGMIHVFFQLWSMLDDGKRALDEASAALRMSLVSG